MSIKKTGKKLLCGLLEAQVRRLRLRNDIKLIAVAGSVGKTSTKTAIAATIESIYPGTVRYQAGNYNDRLTVPLVIFGHSEPAIFNIIAWCKIVLANERILRSSFAYEYVIVELGTDRPGEMQDFAYLQPDIGVLTAVAEEHMEQFKTLQAVAAEELMLARYARTLLINTDDVDASYMQDLSHEAYGSETAGGYPLPILGDQGKKIVGAAIAVCVQLGIEPDVIADAVQAIKPVAGRMRPMRGIKGSTIIDDSYNASPIAVEAALKVLYDMDAPQRIAILGSMNELGDGSAAAHRAIGTLCNPAKVDLIITIGEMAERYLAPAALDKGCIVQLFDNPYDAGRYAAGQLKQNAVILVKGSQGGIFSEEAIKPLLADQADTKTLVRQSPEWLAKKRRAFGALAA